MISVIRKATATATSWVVWMVSRSRSMTSAARGFGRAGAKFGGELGQQRAQRDPAILLHLGEMVAVDDRQRPDAAADRVIGGARFGRFGGAAVDVEQRGDDLEVVLHPVVDFAHQPPLAVERCGHLALRLLDAVDRRGRRRRAAPGFPRAGRACGQVALFAGLEAGDGALEPPQRADQQPRDQQPGDQRRQHPHQQRQQQHQPVGGGDQRHRAPMRATSWPLPSGHSLSAWPRSCRSARRPDQPQLAHAVADDQRFDVAADARARRCAVRRRGRRRSPSRRSRRRGGERVGRAAQRATPDGAGRDQRQVRRYRRCRRPRTAACRRRPRARTAGRRRGRRRASAGRGRRRRPGRRQARRWRRCAGPARCARSGSRSLRAAARAWSSVRPRERGVGLRMPLPPTHDQSEPDRQQRRGQDQEELGRRRQRCEALGSARSCRRPATLQLRGVS